jgi:hypothetical protein
MKALNFTNKGLEACGERFSGKGINGSVVGICIGTGGVNLV